MIEFAFALPFLLTIAMAGTETANLAVTVMRINQLAMLAADNAARVRKSMDEQDINEVMIGIRYAGTGIKFGDYGRVIISGLDSNGKTGADAGYKISWQRCFGAKNVTSSYGVPGDGATNNALANGMGPATNRIKPVDKTALVFAEVRYTYHPLVAVAFMPQQELSAIQSFPVRDRAPPETVTNTTSLPDAQRRLCDIAHLSAA